MKTPFLATLAAGMLALSASAGASTVSYQFTLKTDPNEVNHTVTSYTGTFSYDYSSIIPGAKNEATNLLTYLDIDLTALVNGTFGAYTSYDEDTANTGYLSFASDGTLNGFLFGNDCTAGGCTNGAGKWSATWSATDGGDFAYFRGGSIRNGSIDGVAPVPLPAAAWLFGSALAGMGVIGRRKQVG